MKITKKANNITKEANNITRPNAINFLLYDCNNNISSVLSLQQPLSTPVFHFISYSLITSTKHSSFRVWVCNPRPARFYYAACNHISI